MDTGDGIRVNDSGEGTGKGGSVDPGELIQLVFVFSVTLYFTVT